MNAIKRLAMRHCPEDSGYYDHKIEGPCLRCVPIIKALKEQAINYTKLLERAMHDALSWD